MFALSSKGNLRAAAAAAVVAVAIAVAIAGLLALGSTTPDRPERAQRVQGSGHPSAGTDESPRSEGSVRSAAAKKDAQPAAPAGRRGPGAVAPQQPLAPVAPVASGSVKEPTREEILAGLARGEPGYEVLASRLPVEKTKVTPAWCEGDEWLVDTWYRQMQAPNEPWTGPTTWRFRVVGEVSYRDQPCLEISVTRTDDPAFPPSVFYVTRDHRLAGVHTTVVQQGKQNRVEWTPEAGTAKALKAPFTVVPFDLPAVGAEARVLPPGLSYEPPLAGDTTGADLPAADTLVGHGGAYLELEFESPTDGTTIHQRWSSSDTRWPVYSRTHTTLSYRRER